MHADDLHSQSLYAEPALPCHLPAPLGGAADGCWLQELEAALKEGGFSQLMVLQASESLLTEPVIAALSAAYLPRLHLHRRLKGAVKTPQSSRAWLR